MQTNKKIKVILLDVDGCIFHGNDSKKNLQTHEWLIAKNKQFLEDIVEQVHAENYHKTVVAFAKIDKVKRLIFII